MAFVQSVALERLMQKAENSTCVPSGLLRLPLTHAAVDLRSWGGVCMPTSCLLSAPPQAQLPLKAGDSHTCLQRWFSRIASFLPKSFAVSFQWPILRTLTTRQRSLPFTAINVGSHARAKSFASRPSISTSNASPAKVRNPRHPAQ